MKQSKQRKIKKIENYINDGEVYTHNIIIFYFKLTVINFLY